MKNKLLLLSGTGISRLGDFMYLIALNVMVLHSTNSPAAVAGLWIVGPIATVVTKIWSGSIVDRLNKRSIMLITDIIRAALIGCIPLFDSIWAIYIFIFFDSHCYIIFSIRLHFLIKQCLYVLKNALNSTLGVAFVQAELSLSVQLLLEYFSPRTQHPL